MQMRERRHTSSGVRRSLVGLIGSGEGNLSSARGDRIGGDHHMIVHLVGPQPTPIEQSDKPTSGRCAGGEGGELLRQLLLRR